MPPEFQAYRQYLYQHFPQLFAEADEYEHLGIALCLVPVLQPELLDQVAQSLLPDGEAISIGGIRGSQHRGIIPTGQTWAYFCTGDDLALRSEFVRQLPQYLNNPKALLHIEPAPAGEPFLAGRLVFSAYFKISNAHLRLSYDQRLSDMGLGAFLQTQLGIHQLVLSAEVQQALDEIQYWAQYQKQKTTKSEFAKRIKPGLKVLFHGKPGTGKTQIAAILGNILAQPVYRIDLSQIVSKYIGETEKNLGRVFELAASRQWILFFDEADALFGKRTAVNSSHDRYANQEVAYLLQKIEDYPGVVILASNLKDNIDAAFLRRFQVVAEFQLPNSLEREAIWRKLLAELSKKSCKIQEEDYAQLCKYELSGGSITNAIQYALQKSSYIQTAINLALLKEGIVKELRKENRLVSL